MPEDGSIEVTAIVPAKNERDTIAEVVDRLLALPLSMQVIVVDDGSNDGTTEILRGYGGRITFLRNEQSGGKGAAIRKAIPEARGTAVIVQDADLEYFPEEIPKLVAPILEGKEAVVYGTRFAHGMPDGMKPANKLVNLLLAWSVGILFFRRITDEATCYKAFRRDVLESMHLTCHRFEFCPEATAKAIRMGHRILEIPIRYEPRTKEAGKKIRWTDAPEAFWTLLKHRFSKF